MTITTTAHADWSSHQEGAPLPPAIRSIGINQAISEARAAELQEHIRRIQEGAVVAGDPHARARLASILHHLTGWDVFSDEADERTYVSRLWAEDWDSPEDSVYDDE